MSVFLRDLAELGFAGVQNFPTVGLIDGVFRQNLEETGMGYALEVEMIRQASELGLLTAPYVFDPDDARRMTEAGADVLVPHLGLTTSGTIGAETAITLRRGVERVQANARRGGGQSGRACPLPRRPDRRAEDAAYVLGRTQGVVGFFGASSMERLPTEIALTETVRRFKAIPIEGGVRAGG